MASADVTETEDGGLQQAEGSSQSATESCNPAVEVSTSQSPKDKSKSKKTKEKTKEKSKKSSEKTGLKTRSEEKIPDYRWDHGTPPKTGRKDFRRSGSLGNISVGRASTPKMKKAVSLRKFSLDDTKDVSPSKSSVSSSKSTLSSSKSTLSFSKSKKTKTPTDTETSVPSEAGKTLDTGSKESPVKSVSSSKSTVSSGKANLSSSKSKKTKTPTDTQTSVLSEAHKILDSGSKESPLKIARRLRRAGSDIHLLTNTKPKVKRTSSADGLAKLKKSLKGKKSDALKSASYHWTTKPKIEPEPDYRWDKPKLSKAEFSRSKSDCTGYAKGGGPNRVRFSLESNLCIEVPRCSKEEKSELFYSKKEIKVFKSEDQQRKQKNAMEKLQRQAAAADMTAFGTTIASPIATSC